MLYFGILISRILSKNEQGEIVPRITTKLTFNDTDGSKWQSPIDIINFIQKTAPNNELLIMISYPPIIDMNDGTYPMCEQKISEDLYNTIEDKDRFRREILAEQEGRTVKSINGFYKMYIPEVYRARMTYPTNQYQIVSTVKGIMDGSMSYDEIRILRINEDFFDIVRKGFVMEQ